MKISEEFRNFIQTYFNFRSTLFWLYQKREMHRFKNFFDSVEKQPLTKSQRRSVILDERRNLVVAGAGAGKTSVIIAKAGYLIQSGKCRADEILLLAFNKDAAKELSERCRDRLGVEVQASTFHALGNQIIRAVEPMAPRLSRLAQDRPLFGRFLRSAIEELRVEGGTWKKIRAFVLGHLKLYKTEFEFASPEEYSAYVCSIELRALSGDLVKSFAELDIANFLFFNGVNFEYEKQFPRTATRYRPDFYLTDHDLWIEHFGIDKNGNTAPFVDQEKYHRQMKWKRNIHKASNTRLVETYSWQKSQGILTTQLNKLLKAEGVKYAPRSRDEILDAMEAAGYTTHLTTLVEMFLSHFKSNHMSFADLERKVGSSSNVSRAKAFKELFQSFFERYQAELDDNDPREIDFNDMISSATEYVETGRFAIPWKYIVVDEFQDISVGRYLLLKAMLQSRNDLRFFAVGDDWQSIYRFAGSDISIMSRFRNFFGRATIVKLDRTFRFNDRISQVSSAFVQKNPDQIRKTLTTTVRCETPQVFLHWVNSTGANRRADAAMLAKIVQKISGNVVQDDPSLLILSRYNHALPDQALHQTLQAIWPGQIKPSLTVHRSKGLEADYVIVTGLTANRYGFPSQIEDDPLIDLVLAKPETYPNAEERRLFYVALTRARHQVHLVADRHKPSLFALELVNGQYDIGIVDSMSEVHAPQPI
jgi:DNA helicase IV